MPAIEFEACLTKIGATTLLRLPLGVSEKLPSRGMTMVKGSLNGTPFLGPLEPDGAGSHWLEVGQRMQSEIEAHLGDSVRVSIEPTREWTEPEVPLDLKEALASNPHAQGVWEDITPAARWDWIRWINSTGNKDTRAKRIGVALSKMNSGMRRPCCFNRNICTVPEVSKNGVLL